MDPIRNKANKGGMIYRGVMPPQPPENRFFDDFLQAVKRDDGTDIFYPKNNKVPSISETGFSIIIEGSNFDIDPVIPLKP